MSGQSGPILDASAWTAADFPQPRQWAMAFTPAMLAEIDEAVGRARAGGLAFWQLTPETFPLPGSEPLLARARDELESGRGFAVLSGFPVDRYGYEENLLAYAGVAAHLGTIVVQTHKGDRVIDVVDKGLPYSAQQRGYSSNRLLPFHTDGATIAGLLCLGTAEEGGLSVIVSAPEVYNRIREERPDLLELLVAGFHHHRRGEQGAGEPPVSAERIPVFSFHQGLLHCCYNRNPIDWAQTAGVSLDGREIEALDYLDAVAARPALQLQMDLQPGDMQFVNNFVILHSRGDYRDGPRHRRHLVRLWLDVPDSRRVGPTLLDLYAPTAARRRA